MRCNKPKDTFIQKTYYVANFFPSSGVDISIASVEYMQKNISFFNVRLVFLGLNSNMGGYRRPPRSPLSKLKSPNCESGPHPDPLDPQCELELPINTSKN